MGKIKEHLPVKYFAAVCFTGDITLEAVLLKLKTLFGPVDERSPVYDFDRFTDYYKPEMGSGLQKLFISFQRLHLPEALIDFKHKSNLLEMDYTAQKGRRRVNIDPGYLTDAKIVLATTKDYSHRLYLGKGIYGDLHLSYRNGRYRPQPWTYPDYSQPLALEYFSKIRELYRRQLKEEHPLIK